MNGWFLSQVRLETPVLSYRFSLGAITSNNSGVYRCRCGVEPPVDIQLPALSKWTMLSNALEVTGKGKQGDNGVRRLCREVDGEASIHMTCYLLALIQSSVKWRHL